jgi:hypothetical protein
MEKPSTPQQAELAAKLAIELAGLRDSLVTLSLCLKDWQFEIDRTRRQAAQREALQALEKCRTLGQAPCDRKRNT